MNTVTRRQPAWQPNPETSDRHLRLMHMTDTHIRICNDLIEKGWSQQDNFLAPELQAELTAACRMLNAQGQFHPAGIGRSSQPDINTEIRGDQIQWLEAGLSASTDRYLEIMDKLRLSINQQLYLGLDHLECHFAAYPPGTFYQPHLDRFRDNDSRTISSVFYLNPDWIAQHAGELRLHLKEETITIAPIANRLVCFLSADILHEVATTAHERLSLTGWFRRRD